MSAYENVVGGKLKLKGKALDVKSGGVKKKKKKDKQLEEQAAKVTEQETAEGEKNTEASADTKKEENTADKSSGDADKQQQRADRLTPAERRYIEQKQKLDVHKLAKEANKSHRDRIQDFNQYLANMSEHYDIPKVGPG